MNAMGPEAALLMARWGRAGIEHEYAALEFPDELPTYIVASVDRWIDDSRPKVDRRGLRSAFGKLRAALAIGTKPTVSAAKARGAVEAQRSVSAPIFALPIERFGVSRSVGSSLGSAESLATLPLYGRTQR